MGSTAVLCWQWTDDYCVVFSHKILTGYNTASPSWWNRNQMSNRNRCPSQHKKYAEVRRSIFNKLLKKYTATTAESSMLSQQKLFRIKHKTPHSFYWKYFNYKKEKLNSLSLFCSRLDHGLKYQMFSPGDAEKVDNLKRTSPNSFQIVLC